MSNRKNSSLARATARSIARRLAGRNSERKKQRAEQKKAAESDSWGGTVHKKISTKNPKIEKALIDAIAYYIGQAQLAFFDELTKKTDGLLRDVSGVRFRRKRSTDVLVKRKQKPKAGMFVKEDWVLFCDAVLIIPNGGNREPAGQDHGIRIGVTESQSSGTSSSTTITTTVQGGASLGVPAGPVKFDFGVSVSESRSESRSNSESTTRGETVWRSFRVQEVVKPVMWIRLKQSQGSAMNYSTERLDSMYFGHDHWYKTLEGYRIYPTQNKPLPAILPVHPDYHLVNSPQQEVRNYIEIQRKEYAEDYIKLKYK